jgi:hypothetical protein
MKMGKIVGFYTDKEKRVRPITKSNNYSLAPPELMGGLGFFSEQRKEDVARLTSLRLHKGK